MIDSETRAPINGADVRAGNAGVLTNANGSFTLSVPAGRYTVTATMVGYDPGTADVNVTSGSVEVEIVLVSTAFRLNPVVVTASRQRSERTLSAPSQVNVATAEQIEVLAPTTPVDYVKAMPGVDVIQTGINQSNTVARGFNNIFSGALLVLTDNRYARVPSLRFNAYNMIPTTPLDVERVEVVLGPASALYGPNSANGVMHIITTSPIDKPGTSISLSGGSRNIFTGAFRQAFRFNDMVGLKVSGQYFRGDDFEYTDPVEVAQGRGQPQQPAHRGARLQRGEVGRGGPPRHPAVGGLPGRNHRHLRAQPARELGRADRDRGGHGEGLALRVRPAAVPPSGVLHGRPS